MTLTVAIVGRPNVGKSTLFNRLAGKKIALVDDSPGVTRDRKEGSGRLGDLELTLVDTAGFEDVTDASLEARMRRQTERAIGEADVCLFVIDAREGVTPPDRRFAQLLRKSHRPVVLVANKCEGRQADAGLMEAWRLGFGEPVALSAEHGEGMADLYTALLPFEGGIPPSADDQDIDDPASDIGETFNPDEEVSALPDSRPIRLAFVGRPNAGKSTLLNALLGEDRLVTGPEAGITRDSVTISWTWKDRDFRLIDTAGLRKRARVQEKLERLSTSETIRSIRFADVVVLVMDQAEAFEKQDLQIAHLVIKEGRAIVFAIAKWDAADDPRTLRREMEARAAEAAPQAKGASVIPVSGLTGFGLDRLMEACLKAHKDWSARVKTRDLNDWLAYVVQKHPPPAPDGKRIRPRYMAQMKTRPPTFVLMASRAEDMPEPYKRYLINELREAFEMPGTPIRLVLRQGKNPYAEKS
jgi:GTP-binding protein